MVFPAPFAPRNPKISPFETSKEIWSTAVKSPKILVICSAFMAILLFIFYLFKSNTISYSFTFSPAFRCNLTLRAKRSNPKLFAHNVRISTAIGARNTFRFFFSLLQIYYVQEFFFNIAFLRNASNFCSIIF